MSDQQHAESAPTTEPLEPVTVEALRRELADRMGQVKRTMQERLELIYENGSLRSLLQELMVRTGWERSADGTRWVPPVGPAPHYILAEKHAKRVGDLEGALRVESARAADEQKRRLALEREVEAELTMLGNHAVYVREGGGPPDLAASLAASIANITQHLPVAPRGTDPHRHNWTLANAGHVFRPLYEWLCKTTGATPQQFAKFDPARGTFEPDQNPDHYATTVQLLDLMRIPGSGWEWIAYAVISPPACELRRLGRVQAQMREDLATAEKRLSSAQEGTDAFRDAAADVMRIKHTLADLAKQCAALVDEMYIYDPQAVPIEVPKTEPAKAS